jgi:hypothetical protein
MNAAYRMTLTDVENDVWRETFELRSEDLGGPRGAWSIVKRVLRGGLRDGVDWIGIHSGAMKFSILPTRGMGLWQGDYNGLFIGWKAPVRGPVHPKFVHANERGNLGWLQGFDECMVRCGLESNGAPCTDALTDNNGNPIHVDLPLHGRIANLPASRVEVEVIPGAPPELLVWGEVDESMLFGTGLRLRTRISTRVGSPLIAVQDEIINLKATPSESQLLYHWNFAAPFLDTGARVAVPTKEVVPRDSRAAEGVNRWNEYAPPRAGFIEQAFYLHPTAGADGWTPAILHNARADKAVVLRFQPKQLPCFSIWKNTCAESDGYVTGLEPGTNFPNLKPFERGQNRVVRLAPGASYKTETSLEILDSAEKVSAVLNEIKTLNAGQEPKIISQPQPKYSPAGAKSTGK